MTATFRVSIEGISAEDLAILALDWELAEISLDGVEKEERVRRRPRQPKVGRNEPVALSGRNEEKLSGPGKVILLNIERIFREKPTRGWTRTQLSHELATRLPYYTRGNFMHHLSVMVKKGVLVGAARSADNESA